MNKNSSQRGVTLIFTILIVGLSVAVILSVTILVLREKQSANLIDNAIQAYYTAESGIERSLYEFRTTADEDLMATEDSLLNGTAQWKRSVLRGIKRDELQRATVHVHQEESLELYPSLRPESPMIAQPSYQLISWESSESYDSSRPVIEVTIIKWPKKSILNPRIEADEIGKNILSYNDIPKGNIDVIKQTFTLQNIADNQAFIQFNNFFYYDFRVRIRSMQVGSTFTLAPQHSSMPVDPILLTRSITIDSYGSYHASNSGIEVTFYKPGEAPLLSVFDYVLFSDKTIPAPPSP